MSADCTNIAIAAAVGVLFIWFVMGFVGGPHWPTGGSDE